MAIPLETIYAGMFTVPTIQNVRDFDMIICNKPLKTRPGTPAPESTANFSGVQCKNYRAVKYGEPPVNLYLRIGSIDLNAVNTEPVGLTWYLNNFCEQEVPIESDTVKKAEIEETNRIIRLGSGGKTIYFKGAYNIFPLSWQTDALSRAAFDSEPLLSKLKIFEKATQGILVNILPILEKIGFKTIVVDPEPGFHPKTKGMTNAEKIAGLIKIYETMGLKKISCKIRKTIFAIPENTRDTPINTLRERAGLSTPAKFDQTVMIGDITQMINKFRGPLFDGAVATATGMKVIGLGTAIGQEAINANDSKQVSIKFIPSYDFPDYLDEATFRRIKTDESLNIEKRFEKKYLKYKQKYLALKSKI